MCGIIGYVGKSTKAITKTISCLEKLEYRGYDSAGIAYINNNQIIIKKERGRIETLKKELDFNTNSNLAIAHTRWATHGDANNINAHPHQVGHVTLVHNGIIENYLELKDMLEKLGYTFKSETDTEIGCAMIDYLYQKNNNHLKALNELTKILKGSYALGIIFDDDINTLYAIRKDSPLIVGINKDEFFIASDIPAILEYTNKYITLEDNDIAMINNEVKIYHHLKEVKKDIQSFDYEYVNQDKGKYEHFMLKEINEQPAIIYNLLNENLDNNLKDLPDLTHYKRIDVVGCGSAYHTALVAKTLFEEYASIEINCYIASEYRYQRNFYTDKSIVIFISQSGETADTLACLRKVKDHNIPTLAIVNAYGSSIAREADQVIYTKAGSEIAVATTKAYTAQVTILSLLALKCAYKKKIITSLDDIKESCHQIKDITNKLIKNTDYLKIAKKIYKKRDIFFIGRLIDYATALEGSLKLKEISYINSATYPAGELKHGTISLVEKDTPVITILTYDAIKDKTISNIKEVKTRGARVIIISNQELDSQLYDDLIIIPKVNIFIQPILTIIPLQLLAYHVAKLNKCDIDKPRNLAKSVTVE